MKISISSLKSFKSCRRAYELAYVEGLRPTTKAEALEIGSNYHSNIENIYNNGYFEWNTSKESAMALAYEKYIYPLFNVKSVEDWFSYDLGNGDTLIGRTDGIADDGCLVEHKTTGSEIGEDYEYNLLWDEQILAYMLATGSRKVYYTVCRKPTIRQKQNESDEDFFDRMCKWYDEDTDKKIRLLEITRTDEEVKQFEESLHLMCDEMNHALKTCNYYKNTQHCNCWGRRCEYSSICLNYNPKQEYIGFTKQERRDRDGN